MPRNKYPEVTEEKILNVSLRLFSDKGYDQTTILDIAANLDGMTRGAVYHHFKSKEEILNALGEKLFLKNNPFEKLAEEKGLSGLQKLKKLVLFPTTQDVRNVTQWSLSILKDPQFLARALESNQNVLKPHVKKIIEEGIIDGSLKVQNSEIAAELVLLLANFWTAPSLFPCSYENIEHKVHALKVMFDALGVPIIDEETTEAAIKSLKTYN